MKFYLAAGSGWLELPIEVLGNADKVLHDPITVIGEDRRAALQVSRIAPKVIG